MCGTEKMYHKKINFMDYYGKLLLSKFYMYAYIPNNLRNTLK